MKKAKRTFGHLILDKIFTNLIFLVKECQIVVPDRKSAPIFHFQISFLIILNENNNLDRFRSAYGGEDLVFPP